MPIARALYNQVQHCIDRNYLHARNETKFADGK